MVTCRSTFTSTGQIGHINGLFGSGAEYRTQDRPGQGEWKEEPRRSSPYPAGAVNKRMDCCRQAVLHAARRAAFHQSKGSCSSGGGRAGLMVGGEEGRSMQARKGLMTSGWVMVEI